MYSHENTWKKYSKYSCLEIEKSYETHKNELFYCFFKIEGIKS